MESDFEYYTRRAQEEREASMKAPHLSVRQAHAQMAERYRDLASAIGQPAQQSVAVA